MRGWKGWAKPAGNGALYFAGRNAAISLQDLRELLHPSDVAGAMGPEYLQSAPAALCTSHGSRGGGLEAGSLESVALGEA